MLRRHHVIALLAALAWAGGPEVKSARAEYLSDLIATNGSIQVGNEVFDRFAYSATGNMPSASKVSVSVVTESNGQTGLRFTGGFTDTFESHGAQKASDAALSYRVQSLGNPINGLSLFGNPLVIGGPGLMATTETFQSGTVPYQLDIHDKVGSNGVHDTKLTDSVQFSPVLSLEVVTKDIFALSLGGIPTQSFVDQTFAHAVPEPSAAVLGGLGLLGLAGYARFRRRRAK